MKVYIEFEGIDVSVSFQSNATYILPRVGEVVRHKDHSGQVIKVEHDCSYTEDMYVVVTVREW